MTDADTKALLALLASIEHSLRVIAEVARTASDEQD